MSEPAGRVETLAFRRNLQRLLGVTSLMSMVAAGLLGLLVTPRLGPYLVMGAMIYTGNTDVEPPEAPFPWAGLALGVALLGLGLWRVRTEARGGWFLSHLGGAIMALAPFAHLWLLWRAMGR